MIEALAKPRFPHNCHSERSEESSHFKNLDPSPTAQGDRSGLTFIQDLNVVHGFSARLMKNGLFVILNEVKDIELIKNTRFFASLRMTNRRNEQL